MTRHLRRDALVVIVFSALVLAAIGLGLHASWQQKLADGRQLTEGVVRALVIRLERDLMSADQGLNDIVTTLRADPDLLRPGEPALARLVAMMRRSNPSVMAFGVMRPDGRFIASSTPGLSTDQILRPMSSFITEFLDRTTDDPRLSSPYARHTDGMRLFALLRPLRDETGKLTAVAYAAFPVLGVLTTLEPLIPQPAPGIILVNERFIPLVAAPHDSFMSEIIGAPVQRALAAGSRSGYLEVVSTDTGRDSLISFEASERFGFVAISVNERAVLRHDWITANWAAFAMLTALLVIGKILAIALVAAHRRRALAERALTVQAKSRLQHGMDSTRDGFCIWDKNGELIVWNRRYAEITDYLDAPLRVGLQFSEMIRRGVVVIFPGHDAAAREAWCRSREAAHDRADGEMREFTTPTGRVIEIADQRTVNGDVVTNLRDVTEERRFQQRITESEARFRDGIESMADGFMLWDADDRLVTWNQRTLELLPYFRAVAAVGMPFLDFATAAIAHARPDWSDAERQSWVDMRRQRRAAAEPHEVTLSNGRIIEGVERETSQGGLVTILRDVTARRTEQVATERALAAERETNTQQRRFISIASHEFRTPLAIIDGAVQRLHAHLDTSANVEVTKRLQRIRDAVTRMTVIIDMTLSSARLDAGQIKPELVVFDLADLLRDIVARQRSISPHLEIILTLPEFGLEIAADPPLLDQVFTNLLSNAAKYSPRSSRIEIGASASPEQAEISIRDYGVGIPADEIPKLFTRFFRARTAAGIQGTGIGLHLVHELVTLHGGTIAVWSEAGAGSTFTVRLPRNLMPQSARDAAAD